jgi:AraC-like DNA-binding protein
VKRTDIASERTLASSGAGGRRGRIEPLAFRRPDRPWLGLEIFKLSELYARAAVGPPGDTLFVPQRHEFYCVFIGIKGESAVLVDFEAVPVGARWLSVSARGRVRTFARDRGTADAWMIIFEPALVTELAPKLSILSPLWPQPWIELDGAARGELLASAEAISVEHARPHDAAQPEILWNLFRSLLWRIERLQTAWAGPSETSAVSRFFSILERDHATTRTVAHYAKATALSPRRLGELLLEATGKTTKQIIDERVVLEHKRLLAHTDISVKELAVRTGFDEPTNLVKFFRLHAGTTPAAFREAQRTHVFTTRPPVLTLPAGRGDD